MSAPKDLGHAGRRGSRGFTLVELLVVIGIIALLISILLPTLNRARQSAMEVKCLTVLRELGMANAAYANDHEFHSIPERIGIKDGTYREFKWWFQIREVGEYMSFDEAVLNNTAWAWPLDYYCPSVDPEEITGPSDTSLALESYHMNTTNYGWAMMPWEHANPLYKTYARGIKMSKLKEPSTSAQFTDFANGNNNQIDRRRNYTGERMTGLGKDIEGIAWRHGDRSQLKSKNAKANAVFYDGHAQAVPRGPQEEPTNKLSYEVLRFWGAIGPDEDPDKPNLTKYF